MIKRIHFKKIVSKIANMSLHKDVSTYDTLRLYSARIKEYHNAHAEAHIAEDAQDPNAKKLREHANEKKLELQHDPETITNTLSMASQHFVTTFDASKWSRMISEERLSLLSFLKNNVELAKDLDSKVHPTSSALGAASYFAEMALQKVVIFEAITTFETITKRSTQERLPRLLLAQYNELRAIWTHGFEKDPDYNTIGANLKKITENYR